MVSVLEGQFTYWSSNICANFLSLGYIDAVMNVLSSGGVRVRIGGMSGSGTETMVAVVRGEEKGVSYWTEAL
jgi:hypothetical protein